MSIPGPWELTGREDREGFLVARLQELGDEETGLTQASDIVDVDVDAEVSRLQISTDEPATAAASQPRSSDDASENTALAVAATAAVELTNLLFLLRGESPQRRRGGWIEGTSVLLALAAFLSAAGLVLVVRGAVGKRAAIRDACRRVLLAVSAAALFLASAGMVVSLLMNAPWSREAV